MLLKIVVLYLTQFAWSNLLPLSSNIHNAYQLPSERLKI
jgi:hypothetical protein